ncbi:MAG: L,D-transpeptidase [Spirochaetes bacterium]|nr:L,D-transpeptidase [Spirochaetota bacterium]
MRRKAFILGLLFVFSILLFKNTIIYPFFQEIIPDYFKHIISSPGDNNAINNFSFDIEDLIYVPPVKDLKKISVDHIINDRYIEITIPENILRFYIRDPRTQEFVLKNEYPVSVGKPRTPSQIGDGFIYSKGRIVFKYSYGVNQGKTVEYSHLPDGERIKMPYSRMRGLYMFLNGTEKYIIHSTTEDWLIGQAVSGGCVRMLIDDMLELYTMVKPVMKVRIIYRLFYLEDDLLTVYKDIYSKSIHYQKDLLNFLLSQDINPLMFDADKINRFLSQPLPATISLNELLDDYFISKGLCYDKITIDPIRSLKKPVLSLDFFQIHE